MKMKSIFIFLVCFSAQAALVTSHQDPNFPTGGGNDVPVKGRFDLAHNEEYELIGKIHKRSDGRFEFEVDLKLQPWLATADRVADPFMPIENPEYLGEMNEKTVKVNLIAHRAKTQNCDDPKFFDMTVEFRGIPMLYNRPVPLR